MVQSSNGYAISNPNPGSLLSSVNKICIPVRSVAGGRAVDLQLNSSYRAATGKLHQVTVIAER